MSEIIFFNQLFADYKDKFKYFAYTYLRDEAAAEDIVMDSFIYYWENKEFFENQKHIPAYLLKVVKSKCLNYLRAQNIRNKAEKTINEHNIRTLQTQIYSLEACDPQSIFSEEAKFLVEKALESMKPQTHEIFIRSREMDQSYKKIAEEMNISVKVVEYHISKALQILRLYLKDYHIAVLFLSVIINWTTIHTVFF
jgi:RNA polymerase sigma-70 factor (ECF subfamily)